MLTGGEREERSDDPAWDGPAWELRTALRAARRVRSDSAVAVVRAASELSLEGDGEFTVKQVAERAGVALQTLYRHFPSKDELLLAVIEENVLAGSDDVAAAAVSAGDDPVEQLRAVICRIILMTGSPEVHQRLRFHSRQRPRLAERYPAEIERALAPYRHLVAERLRAALAHVGLDASRADEDAEVIQQLVLSYAHALQSGLVNRPAAEVADHLWHFCWAAVQRTDGRPVTVEPHSRRAP